MDAAFISPKQSRIPVSLFFCTDRVECLKRFDRNWWRYHWQSQQITFGEGSWDCFVHEQWKDFAKKKVCRSFIAGLQCQKMLDTVGKSFTVFKSSFWSRYCYEALISPIPGAYHLSFTYQAEVSSIRIPNLLWLSHVLSMVALPGCPLMSLFYKKYQDCRAIGHSTLRPKWTLHPGAIFLGWDSKNQILKAWYQFSRWSFSAWTTIRWCPAQVAGLKSFFYRVSLIPYHLVCKWAESRGFHRKTSGLINHIGIRYRCFSAIHREIVLSFYPN
jgi:hypothetical protein